MTYVNRYRRVPATCEKGRRLDDAHEIGAIAGRVAFDSRIAMKRGLAALLFAAVRYDDRARQGSPKRGGQFFGGCGCCGSG